VKQLKLFHFDIRTFGNYGDTLLFEAVRNAFHGFADGAAFDVYDAAPLRNRVGPKVAEYINSTADAVVLGGGGLFLTDTTADSASGWQWNISLEILKRIEKPLIIFGVGNNRFIGQPDFDERFREHVGRTLEQSVFFGLRNTGSVNTIREMMPAHLRDRVVYQPCATTLSAEFYPDLVQMPEDEKTLAVELIVGKRQTPVGFDADKIGDMSIDVLSRLKRDGWNIHSVPHARADMKFAQRAAAAGVVDEETVLYGSRDVLFKGVEVFGRTPFIYGTRGHAQMVPFGMGSIPFSAMVHDKLRYFMEDIGRPQWAIDPREPGFEDALYTQISEAYEGRREHREHLATVRERMFDLTLDNLAQIYENLTGSAIEPSFTPYTPRERRLAEKLFVSGIRKDVIEERMQKEIAAARAERTFSQRFATYVAARMPRRVK
jgi:polysaccharide pyruvyl transferase WcaK-like protein